MVAVEVNPGRGKGLIEMNCCHATFLSDFPLVTWCHLAT